MFKLYVPLLEISLAFLTLYLLPEGIIRLCQRAFNYSAKTRATFFIENLRGYLFGTAIAISCVFAFDVKPEDFFANSIRSVSSLVRLSLGMDAITVCVKRAKEEFHFTPEQFANEASEFSILSVNTLTPREQLLAEGNEILLLSYPPSRVALLESAYQAYCRNKF